MAPDHSTPSEAEVADTLSRLELSAKTPSKHASKPKSKPVADSWDDDVSGSGTETETETISRTASGKEALLSPINTSSTSASDDGPNPPPPTPASPTQFAHPESASHADWGARGPGSHDSSRRGSSDANAPSKRPEKTTATASRMIAAGLGLKAPRRTAEEREYDKAMREKERKRRDEERNREKAEREAAEERKRAIWDD
ncbi:hypothetical protein EJ04DRAFT_8176 [Polyplosphaeria fusca]|uniref:Uncharacterized protein n=1 Tax=Polyplosphaeria fusca TaxID=682080 RepID=A0A9P4V768_9PLEO|nr:hypothetical protein EJ04DRAFT_8176 [Polyplosphaeria fusca]